MQRGQECPRHTSGEPDADGTACTAMSEQSVRGTNAGGGPRHTTSAPHLLSLTIFLP